MSLEPLNLLEYETAALECLTPMARDYTQVGTIQHIGPSPHHTAIAVHNRLVEVEPVLAGYSRKSLPSL